MEHEPGESTWSISLGHRLEAWQVEVRGVEKRGELRSTIPPERRKAEGGLRKETPAAKGVWDNL